MKKLHVKTGDTVIILSGKDGPERDGGKTGPAEYKKGKVLQVSPKEGKVIVEGLNMVTKHVKPRKMGEAGGRIDAEGALYACKVQLVCPSCNEPTRVGHKIVEEDRKDGKTKKVNYRMCKKCGETFK